MNDSPTAERDENDGATPLDPDEREGLIPTHVATRGQLNQWEAVNIGRGYEWARNRKRLDPLDESVLRELHRRMFDETWSWAGTFRQTDNNLSPHSWTQVAVLVRGLTENTRTQLDACDKSSVAIDEIAIRFHYELVRVHPWPNGNGRHARLATDLLLLRWERQPFSWGSGDLAKGAVRARYIAALRAADRGDFNPLRAFVRS